MVEKRKRRRGRGKRGVEAKIKEEKRSQGRKKFGRKNK